MYAGLADEKNTCTSCTGALARGAGVAGSNASQFRMTNLGARMPFGALSVFTQVTRINDRSQYTVNPGDRDATWFGVGAEYALSTRTSLSGTMATVGNKNGSGYALGSGTAQQPANAVAPGNPRANTAVVGIRHFL